MTKRQKSIHPAEIIQVEHGLQYTPHPCWIAFGYPAPYSVAASSLGYQTVYRHWNTHEGISCERFVYDGENPQIPRTLESAQPISAAAALAFSMACETDLLPVVQMMRRSGISPLRKERTDSNIPVIAGGPLTLLSPELLSPLADVVVCGEGEDALDTIANALADSPNKSLFLKALSTAADKGIWIPSLAPAPRKMHTVGIDRLPAFAATWSSLADFKDLFLVEIARGCPRRCAFCLLAQSGRFRAVPKEVILSKIPDSARGVGLVGAAVTDHPHLEEIVAEIVARQRRVSLSSMRADRLTPELLSRLVEGGLRTLTVAADGASEAIRARIRKGITEQHLIDAAKMARTQKLKGLKLYSMVGLPDETDADMVDFARLVTELSKLLRITVAIQSFVPKPNTPLGNVPMVETRLLKQRLNSFQRQMKGRVIIQSTSPRWSWVDWKLAHSKERGLDVAMAVSKTGGDFSDWKRAIANYL
ncbi:MAG: radical SAM protein [Deltaproteobacteria bacterium]|nr:radical SAM protein [Deltaproteobacteria bacterium]